MFSVLTILFIGVPAFMLLVMALAAFSAGQPGMGLISLLGACGLVALLIWKLNNPDWSLLNSGQHERKRQTKEQSSGS